jgi:benzil reductase ((S)-benzoin forming)
MVDLKHLKNFNMKKKIFIISGANRGLGKAFTDVLLKNEDYFIVSISRRMSKEQKKYSLRDFYFLEVDLSKNDVKEKITALKDIINDEDIYFLNNASIINPITKIENLNEEEIDKTISVNIKSTILITKYLLKNFNANTLTFVNISSGASERAISNWSLYCSSKAYIKMFFNVAKSEYLQHQFFNFNPGVMDTNMQKSIRKSDFPDVSNFKELQEKGNLKSPIDVAKEILNAIV